MDAKQTISVKQDPSSLGLQTLMVAFRRTGLQRRSANEVARRTLFVRAQHIAYRSNSRQTAPSQFQNVTRAFSLTGSCRHIITVGGL